MDQKAAIASLNARLGLGKRKARPSPAAKRREIQAGQVAVLEKVLTEIRRRARETPAWASAYHSAATAVELELASVRDTAHTAAQAALAQRKPAGSMGALALWAESAEPGSTLWDKGYEAARSWVKVQIDAHSGKVGAPVADCGPTGVKWTDADIERLNTALAEAYQIPQPAAQVVAGGLTESSIAEMWRKSGGGERAPFVFANLLQERVRQLSVLTNERILEIAEKSFYDDAETLDDRIVRYTRAIIATLKGESQ